MSATDLVQRLMARAIPTHSPEYAYEMGRDCAVNGANLTNCHFSIFSSPENTRAWERGKRDAETTPAAPQGAEGEG